MFHHTRAQDYVFSFSTPTHNFAKVECLSYSIHGEICELLFFFLRTAFMHETALPPFLSRKKRVHRFVSFHFLTAMTDHIITCEQFVSRITNQGLGNISRITFLTRRRENFKTFKNVLFLKSVSLANKIPATKRGLSLDCSTLVHRSAAVVIKRQYYFNGLCLDAV